MMTAPKLPFLLRFFPLWELIAFILVGWWIGFGWAFLILICTSVLGVILVRAKGFRMMRNMKENPMMGAAAMISGLQNSLFLLGGFLLIIPGFITDIFGILCLIPPVRKFLINKFISMNMKAAQAAFSQMNMNQNTHKPAANEPEEDTQVRQGQTVEGEFWEENDNPVSNNDNPKNEDKSDS